VASVRSIVAGGNNIQYDTTKHVVAGLTRGLAMDHGAEGIRINAVCSEPVFTPFDARRLQKAGKTVAQYNEDAASRTMLKRPGTAEEVAACIFFLVSNEASYVTGSLPLVDGGLTAM
jgi:NAD(P)-dependent dehydrogenase (short-subunit alcohol dehydrogenase family)